MPKGVYIRIHAPWNKGFLGCYVQSEESNRKRSEALRGRRLSETTKMKLSVSKIGKPLPIAGWNKGLPKELQPCCGKKNTLGYHHSEESKQRMSSALRGRQITWGDKIWDVRHKNSIKKFGIESIDKATKDWKRAILIKDNGVCVKVGCKNTDQQLCSHHILSREEHPELIFDVMNGCLLCRADHAKYHGLYGENGSRETLAEFLYGRN